MMEKIVFFVSHLKNYSFKRKKLNMEKFKPTKNKMKQNLSDSVVSLIKSNDAL